MKIVRDSSIQAAKYCFVSQLEQIKSPEAIQSPTVTYVPLEYLDDTIWLDITIVTKIIFKIN